MSDIEFVNGLIIKPPTEKQIYLKARLSIKREELIAWLTGKDGEWINIDVKESRNDKSKWYAAVNNWKPDGAREQQATPQSTPPNGQKVDPIYQGNADDFDSDSIPF